MILRRGNGVKGRSYQEISKDDEQPIEYTLFIVRFLVLLKEKLFQLN